MVTNAPAYFLRRGRPFRQLCWTGVVWFCLLSPSPAGDLARGAADTNRPAMARSPNTNDPNRWLLQEGVIGAIQKGDDCYVVYKRRPEAKPEIVSVMPIQTNAAAPAAPDVLPSQREGLLSSLAALWQPLAQNVRVPELSLAVVAALTLAGLGLLGWSRMRRSRLVVPVAQPVARALSVRPSHFLPPPRIIALHGNNQLPPISLPSSLAAAVRPAELSGSLGAVAPEALLQMFNAEGQTGTLTVTDASRNLQGVIVFSSGAMASIKTLQGEGPDALREILKCRRGHFTFDPQPAPPIPQPLAGDFTGLLMDALRGLDEEEAAMSATKV